MMHHGDQGYEQKCDLQHVLERTFEYGIHGTYMYPSTFKQNKALMLQMLSIELCKLDASL